MVLAGIGAGIIIIILEIVYHKHRGWREEQRDLAKKTTEVWKNNVMITKNGRGIRQESRIPKREQNGNHVTQETRINPIFVSDAQIY